MVEARRKTGVPMKQAGTFAAWLAIVCTMSLIPPAACTIRSNLRSIRLPPGFAISLYPYRIPYEIRDREKKAPRGLSKIICWRGEKPDYHWRMISPMTFRDGGTT